MPDKSGQLFFRALVGLVLAMAAIQWCRAQDSDLKSRLLKEAPSQWEEYGQFVAHLQGKKKSKATFGGKLLYEYTLEIKQNANCSLMSIHWEPRSDPKESGSGNVFATNTQYAFSLKRKAKDAGWVLGDLEFQKNTPPASPLAMNAHEYARGHASLLLRATYTPLAELIKCKSFRVIEAKEVVHAERPAVRVEFDNSHPYKRNTKPFIPEQKGVLVLDPANAWCLCHCDIVETYYGSEKRTRVDATYRETPEKFPIPARIVEHGESRADGTEEWKTFFAEHEYQLEKPARLPPESEFTSSSANAINRPTRRAPSKRRNRGSRKDVKKASDRTATREKINGEPSRVSGRVTTPRTLNPAAYAARLAGISFFERSIAWLVCVRCYRGFSPASPRCCSPWPCWPSRKMRSPTRGAIGAMNIAWLNAAAIRTVSSTATTTAIRGIRIVATALGYLATNTHGAWMAVRQPAHLRVLPRIPAIPNATSHQVAASERISRA
ncbi:MAG: hypothetical protein HYR84_09280 [Planctomycetes bacterium]|nr:hypothetical protein [Planctomycetota bacterium]